MKGPMSRTRFIVVSALMAAVGVLLTLLEFPLPFFPPFLHFNVADLPCLLAAFVGGPWMGVTVILLKNLLFTFLRFSSEQVVGCVANILVGLAYVLPAGLLYRAHRDRKHALLGAILGTVCMAAVAMVTNYFINIPFYAALMHVDVPAILAMTGAPVFGTMMGYLLVAVLPFNLLRGAAMTLLEFLIYKPVKAALRL